MDLPGEPVTGAPSTPSVSLNGGKKSALAAFIEMLIRISITINRWSTVPKMNPGLKIDGRKMPFHYTLFTFSGGGGG